MGRKGNLFVVSGPSGVGKGTICAILCRRRPDIKLSVSCATRKQRPNETDGVHYFFVTNDQFDVMIHHDELLEHANVHGNRYGTPRAFVKRMLDEGCDVILEIDVQGGAQIISKNIPLTPVFILPPSKAELVSRLTARGTESKEQIALRIQNASRELKQAERYPYLVVNDDREAASRRLEAIIDASHETIADQMPHLESLYQQFQEE